MLTHELKNRVSKEIEITLVRRHILRRYRGRLIAVSKAFVCLESDTGRTQWVPKPNKFGDIVKELNKV